MHSHGYNMIGTFIFVVYAHIYRMRMFFSLQSDSTYKKMLRVIRLKWNKTQRSNQAFSKETWL